MAEYIKNCELCGKEFITSRDDTRFCGSPCRSKANRNLRIVHDSHDATSGKGSEDPSKIDLMAEILDEVRSIKTIVLNQNERILTIDGVCEELSISKPTFERLQAEGLIKVHRFGGKETKGRSRKPFILFSELVDVLRSDVVSKVDQIRTTNDGEEN